MTIIKMCEYKRRINGIPLCSPKILVNVGKSLELNAIGN